MRSRNADVETARTLLNLKLSGLRVRAARRQAAYGVQQNSREPYGQPPSQGPGAIPR
jgi:hypothetical protein